MNTSTRQRLWPWPTCFCAAALLPCGRVIVALTAFGSSYAVATELEQIDLAGVWQFQLDPRDEGVDQRWHERHLPETIRLPGSLQQRGFGDEVTAKANWTGNFDKDPYFQDPRYAAYRQAGHVKVPFCLQPKKIYVGPAWYQRTIDLPQAWRGRRVIARLERCHWTTTSWLDGCELGKCNSLSVPHEFELTRDCQPGSHVLTVRVDNRLAVDVGRDAHSVSDHTQTNWNGIIGKMALEATPRVWIEHVRVMPDAAAASMRVQATIGNVTGKAGAATLSLEARGLGAEERGQPARKSLEIRYGADETTVVEADLSLGPKPRLWDEFDAYLYRLTVALNPDQVEASNRSVQVGLRDVAVVGTQVAVNGRPRFLRGTLECCVFPLTGYPPTDAAAWGRIFRTCQAHGLNHVRFHSYCPPEAAFDAADREGVYLQVEAACWAHVGQGQPIDEWIYNETQRILDAYGNHPSFLLMTHGNEPWPKNEARDEYLAEWIEHFKQRESRQLFTCGSGWPTIEANQFHVTPEPRIQQWGEGLKSRINALPPSTTADYREHVERHSAPVICHEMGQWCAYPNFAEIDKYSGVLKPRNLEIFRDFLREAKLEGQARDFLAASGKLQVLCYKEDIEAALRTPDFGGFQLLGLSDFPGQGSALVGVLDAFWHSKPYVAAEDFRRFCSATTPLARLPKRVFVDGETIEADIDVAHFGPADLHDVVVSWQLASDGGEIVARGELDSMDVHAGRLATGGPIRIPLRSIDRAVKLKLTASVAGAAENDWDLWAYPAPQADAPRDIQIANDLDDACQDLLAGRKVLLLANPARIKTDVSLGFSSIFWNTSWTGNQPPHTLGILCDPRHAAFAQFPTEFHSNWQWWEIVRHAATMELDDLPADLAPLIQVVPDWFKPKKLALAFEARVEGGQLLVCSADLSTNLAERHAARQLRHSLIAYMQSDAFSPACALTVDQVRSLFSEAPDE